MSSWFPGPDLKLVHSVKFYAHRNGEEQAFRRPGWGGPNFGALWGRSASVRRSGTMPDEVTRTNRPSSVRGAAVIRGGRILRGQLNSSDPLTSGDRPNRYADEYRLGGVRAGDQVRVKLVSRQFDPYLQLVNAKTGAVIWDNDDIEYPNDVNASFTFIVQRGGSYIIRVTSSYRREIGSYQLSARSFTPRSIRDYNFAYGYGLVDAAGAVARAAGQDSFKAVPNLGGTRWGLDMVRAPEVWKAGYTGQGVVVAVLDSGVDYRHPDLKTNMWRNRGEIPGNGIDDDGNGFMDDVRGWDFADGDANPMDPIADGHGSHVAGAIAAARNTFGVTGVAYNATIMPVRVLGLDGGTDHSIASGIRYAVKNGANIINMSLGKQPGDILSAGFKNALHYAKRSGVTVVISAGNDRQEVGTVRPVEPALYASNQKLGIVVGAVNRTRQVASFSNPAGNWRRSFLVAPGQDIRSTLPLDAYGFESGTSMAAPHVAGVVALMLSANPTLTVNQITSILKATANSARLSVEV